MIRHYFYGMKFFERSVVPQGLTPVYGNTVQSAWEKETHKNLEVLTHQGQKKHILTATNFPKYELDLSFLPAAAESYCLSPDPKDYVIVSLPILSIDIPNRNSQAFPLQEVAYFDPTHGRLVYQTFCHKPTHTDHINDNPREAKGVHIDASMQYLPRYDLWKTNVLTMWDRTKDAKLVQEILDRKRTGYSMGALVSAFACSICGHLDTNNNPCEHLKADHRGRGGKGTLWGNDNRLAYQVCCGVTFFETSSVVDPADSSAWSQDVFA